MAHGLGRAVVTACFIALALMVGTHAYGQAGAATTSLSGTVIDSSGAVIPGADVTIKNNATGSTFTAVTGANGSFTIPALSPGSYTVHIALMGFKSWIANDVALSAAIPATVRATLEVGNLEETVVVQGGAEIVQTTSAAVATTLNVKAVSNLPLGSRSVLDVMVNMPGVDMASTSLRDAHVMGLPQSAINITLDGMNIQDNYLKTTDGMFTRVSPRLDSIEEVTYTSAAQGAESAGQGAVQIRFATRSGTNQLRGSSYYYFRNDSLNNNTWFNIQKDLPKPALTLHQPGTRVGGPIVIPGLFDGHNKAFFFLNYEESRSPSVITRNRTILSKTAQQGIFTYGTKASGYKTVDLLALATRFGQTATLDPIVTQLLSDIRASTSEGTLSEKTNPSTEGFSFQQDSTSKTVYPTFRLDFNLSDRHRLSGSSTINHLVSEPDTTNSRERRFPGFPAVGIQDSWRYTWQTGLRSTFTQNMVNELRVGGSGGATLFNPNYSPDMWGGTSVANQAGYRLSISDAMGIDNASAQPNPSSREASTKVVEDSLNWIKGAHSLSFGGSFTRVDLWLKNQTTLVPTIGFGVVTGDPAESMFSTTNFPGASSSDLTNAKNLYAVLTGRVDTITREARINTSGDKFVPLGQSLAQGRMHNLGFHAQDSWKVRKGLTLNLGLRYELQLPFYPINNSYSTATIADVWGITGVAPDFKPSMLVNNTGYLFQPGVLNGTMPTYKQFGKGTKAYNIDWNNLAPNIGGAWTPSVSSDGWMKKFLGEEGDTVLRAGYTVAYQRNGMGDFSDQFGANPGVNIDITRNQSLGNLGTAPLLFSQADRLGLPAFTETRAYPMLPPTTTGSVNIFDPNLQVPYAKTWTVGYQRALSKTMAMEARYVGTHNYDGWTTYDYNEVNILENGFLNEFKAAQSNLQANIAAGRGNTFKYFGPGTGTAPLPIYLAYFSGLPAAKAGDPSNYTSNNFKSSTYYNALATYNPQPFTAAGTGSSGLQGSSTFRNNAIKAGLPANFFVVNPNMLDGANITGNGGYTTYNGMQLELRKRMSAGLQFQLSYAFAKSYSSNRYSFRVDRVKTRQTGAEGGLLHALKGNWVYELPFGRGKRYGGGASSVLDRIIGGWSFYGTGRIQSGRLLDFGNVRLVGMSADELSKAFKLRQTPDSTGMLRVWMLPQDIIDNTVKAFNVSATSATGYGTLGVPTGKYIAPANSDPSCIEKIDDGYGECGMQSLVVAGPKFLRFDMSFAKQIPIKGRVNFEFRAEVYNIFNRVNFVPVYWNSPNVASASRVASNPDAFEVGSADTARYTQLAFRINW